MNRIDGAANHAVGVEAGAATAGDQEAVIAHPFTDQSGDTLMSIRAGLGALIAAGAAFEVNDKQILSVKQDRKSVV